MKDERGTVTDATRAAEAEEAQADHGAGRPADDRTANEADEHPVEDGVRQHYREMTELGAQEVGEGRIG